METDIKRPTEWVKPGTDTRYHELIFNPEIKKIHDSKLRVEKIELSDDYTRIDFIHYADPIYNNGGWVHIWQQTFIRPCSTQDRLGLFRADGIPYAQKKHYYNHEKDRLAFTLWFPALPKWVSSIDMIERSGGDHTFFNLYGIKIRDINSGPLHLSDCILN